MEGSCGALRPCFYVVVTMGVVGLSCLRCLSCYIDAAIEHASRRMGGALRPCFYVVVAMGVVGLSCLRCPLVGF